MPKFLCTTFCQVGSVIHRLWKTVNSLHCNYIWYFVDITAGVLVTMLVNEADIRSPKMPVEMLSHNTARQILQMIQKLWLPLAIRGYATWRRTRNSVVVTKTMIVQTTVSAATHNMTYDKPSRWWRSDAALPAIACNSPPLPCTLTAAASQPHINQQQFRYSTQTANSTTTSISAQHKLRNSAEVTNNWKSNILYYIQMFVYFLCFQTPPRRRVIRQRNLARSRVTTMSGTSVGFCVYRGRPYQNMTF